jgi:hypothetical protein
MASVVPMLLRCARHQRGPLDAIADAARIESVTPLRPNLLVRTGEPKTGPDGRTRGHVLAALVIKEA